jgi:ABC-2 type transport system ATP-binding protein
MNTLEPTINGKKTAMNALEITDLKKTYQSKSRTVEALKGISLNVTQGDFFALLGPNGAGKSTTIGIISSLVNKTSGTVKVFGYDIDSDVEAAKSQIGLVPQEFNFNMFETVLQIVLNQAGYYGVERSEALKRAEKYLKQTDLWEKRNARGRELSGGMKRRLMIARALMHEPKILILDEPTAGVDIEIRRGMWEFLKDLNAQGITIILTTHYLEEAEMLCRNIAIIDNGKIGKNTNMKSLLATLNVETFVLDTSPFTGSPDLAEYHHQIVDDHTIEVEVKKGQGLNAIFKQLDTQDIQVLSMRNKANRLEELFVRLVEEGKSNQAKGDK